MKKLVTLLLFCCSLIAITSCKNSDITAEIQLLSCINKPEISEETPSYRISELIKLETTPLSLITYVLQVKMTETHIFIQDINNLYAFAKDGKFISQIGKRGEAPSEYLKFNTFFIDEDKQEVVILDDFKKALIVYDYSGKYLSKINLPEESIRGGASVVLAESNKLLINHMMDMHDTKAYSLFDLVKNETIGRYFSYQPIRLNGYINSFSNHSMTRTSDGADFIMPLCDTIFTYSASTSTFSPKFKVETPRKIASKSQIKDRTSDYAQDLINLSEQGFFTGFTAIFETDDKILLSYKDQGYTMGYALFDKQTRKGGYYLYSYDDETNQLPFYYIIGEYKNTFIGSISAGSLMGMENIKDPTIGKIIKSLKEDDNPCLVLYEFE